MEAQPGAGYWARERDGAVSDGGLAFWTSWYLCRIEAVSEWLSWRREAWGREECETELKWGRGSVGLRQGGYWVQLLLKRNEGLGLDKIIGIYIGYFCNFRVSGFYPGRVSSRVSGFLIKPRSDSDSLQVFFFKKKNPYPTLFLIGPGKTQPIRVGPDQVSASRAKTSIPI